ncbi:glycoside hydrolase family 130 protein [Sinomicrobium sp. M5D2P17]
MRIPVLRKDLKFIPDSRRVIGRFFSNGDDGTRNMIKRIMALTNSQVHLILEQTLREFAPRHRNIFELFNKHCELVRELIQGVGIVYEKLSYPRKMLIGAYCTMEYSIESAAFFNPSIIEDPDQSLLEEGEKRVILSFRATGEGHISSIVFRRGVLDKENNLHLDKVGKYVDMAEIIHKTTYDRERFITKMKEMRIPESFTSIFMENLPEVFEYQSLLNTVNLLLKDESLSQKRRTAFTEITWLMDSYYDVQFKPDSDITERVIFPLSASERNGMEDARFVNFSDDDNTNKIYATYTAFNGHTILPKLLSTDDFYTFRIMPLLGNGAQNKNLALFPKKIKGKYAMLARVDGINNYIMYASRITVWNNPILLQKPESPWEFRQIGNCGSPLWTPQGWLVITHGVGPMRRYCIGASLLDLEDPAKVLGRLEEPLLIPLENERDGYVPNVVYSCGAIIHNDSLILPYAVSDYASAYAVISMPDLIKALTG